MQIVRESISFERGRKPRESMGIGLDGAIYHYFKENYDDIPLDYAIIDRILEEDDLDADTKKDWVTHLLKKDANKYTFEDPELYSFEEYGIDYLDALSDGFHRNLFLDLLKEDGKFYVIFSDMSDFADLFDTHSTRDISKETLEDILGGDAWDIFETSVTSDQAKEYIIDNWDEIDGTAYLTDSYQYRDGEGETPFEIIDDIFSDEDYSEMADIIHTSLSDAYSSAIESAAYKSIMKEVTNHFEIGKMDWNEERKIYKAPISKEGAEKLFKAAFLGEDKAEYREPYGGYDAEVKPEHYNEYLLPRLEEMR